MCAKSNHLYFVQNHIFSHDRNKIVDISVINKVVHIFLNPDLQLDVNSGSYRDIRMFYQPIKLKLASFIFSMEGFRKRKQKQQSSRGYTPQSPRGHFHKNIARDLNF